MRLLVSAATRKKWCDHDPTFNTKRSPSALSHPPLCSNMQTDGCLCLMSHTQPKLKELSTRFLCGHQSAVWAAWLKLSAKTFPIEAQAKLPCLFPLLSLTHSFWLHVVSLHLMCEFASRPYGWRGCAASHIWWMWVTHYCQTLNCRRRTRKAHEGLYDCWYVVSCGSCNIR